MSLPDSLIERFFRLATDASKAECDEVARALKDPAVNPMSLKKQLAHRIVRMYHDPDAADSAQLQFEKQFSRRELPSEMPVVRVESGAFRARDLLMRAFPGEYTGSKAGALFKQGAVYLDGERITDIGLEIRMGDAGRQEAVFKVGRKYAKVVAES
jgi:tyrosyl-tRNA synthetase